MSTIANVAKLKASLSEILAGVKAGGEVIVTDRGRPVARIVPYAQGSGRLDDLVRSGRLRPGKGKLPKGFFSAPRVKDPKGSVRRAVLEEREDGR